MYDGERALGLWRAAATLPTDRAIGLEAMAAFFREGRTPGPLSGTHVGRLIATTTGVAADAAFEFLTRLWMPWKGKTFDPAAGEGRNLFAISALRPTRLLWPRYEAIGADSPGRFTAFRFLTDAAPSLTDPDLKVLRIDYDLAENPRWPIRRILDEVVEVDDGLYLGQALLRWRGARRRAAWFTLER